VLSQVLIVAIVAVMFLWIYNSLWKVPNKRELAWGQPVWHPAVRSVSSNVTGIEPVGDINQISTQMAPRVEARRVEDMLPR
jgi:hypothetical protein